MLEIILAEKQQLKDQPFKPLSPSEHGRGTELGKKAHTWMGAMCLDSLKATRKLFDKIFV